MPLASVKKACSTELGDLILEAMDNVSIGIIIFDDEYKLLSINIAAQSFLGLGKHSSIGNALDEVFFFSAAIPDMCKKTLATNNSYDCYSEVLSKINQTSTNVIAKSSLIENQDRLILLELIDITKNEALRDERLNSQQQLNKKLARQLAHEIKNPLGGLRGAAQLLDRKLPSQELQKYTKIIIHESDRLTSLVDSILVTSGRPAMKEVNPHEITERVFALLQKSSPKGVSLLKDYDPSLPPIYVDFNQIVQAYLNIAKNAVEAISDNDGTVTFKTRIEFNRVAHLRRIPIAATLSVIDDGPGIPEELMDNIFYPLVSTKETGSGLGLAIAQGLVERNKGSIAAKSRPQYTVFSLIFPLSDTRETL
jgi:two-component system nitrogen regulation sensor histidine kinase GlnL